VHGDTVVASPELTLPHPRLAERAFVLVPLAAVAPELAVPPSGTTVGELLARLGPVAGVERVPWGEAAARRLGLDPAAERD
jgi:2-amino-4-hydroxy-6-hydroxymethyldihydropteridine diphosphokinase